VGSKFSPLNDRIRAYEEVRKLAKDGVRSPSGLLRELRKAGLGTPSRETVRRWANGLNSPLTNLNLFVPTPSDELSFFIGAWYGDGWGDENDGGGRMRLKVRSDSFAQEYADTATEILGKSIPYRVWVTHDDGGPWYNVKVTSRLFFDFLNQDLQKLTKIIEPFPRGFLRGFFTAEGSPTVSIESSPTPWLSVGVVVSNSELFTLRFCSNLLQKLGYKPGKIRINMEEGERTNIGVARTKGWLMTLSRFADVSRFASQIGFADRKKEQKLTDAIEILFHDNRYRATDEWNKLYRKKGKKWVRRISTFNVSS
jgi:intein-encoded DNA endonuclease-like protein